MDPITHTLTGAALARAGLQRATPLAAATLVVAANAPDIDIVAYLGGEYAGLAHRRGWTHGPLGLVALPFLVAGAALAWDRWVRRRRRPDAAPARAVPLLLLSLIGILTHPLLDWMNTYGIRLLMPFDRRWFYGDALFIVDPWVWLILGGGVFLAAERRAPAALVGWAALAAAASLLVLVVPVPRAAKVAWCIGLAGIAVLRVRRSPVGTGTAESRGGAGVTGREGEGLTGRDVHGRAGDGAPSSFVRAARLGLALATLYIALMVAADRLARREAGRAIEAMGAGPVAELMVAPEPANPFAGTVVAAVPGGYRLGTFHWLGRPRVRIRDELLPRGPSGPVVDAARAAEEARRFLVWSRFPYVEVRELEEGYDVWIGDARYVDEPRAGELAGVMVRLDRELRPLRRGPRQGTQITPPDMSSRSSGGAPSGSIEGSSGPAASSRAHSGGMRMGIQ